MTDATRAAQAHGDSIAGVVDERAGRLHDVDHCAGDIGTGNEAENPGGQLNYARVSYSGESMRNCRLTPRGPEQHVFTRALRGPDELQPVLESWRLSKGVATTRAGRRMRAARESFMMREMLVAVGERLCCSMLNLCW